MLRLFLALLVIGGGFSHVSYADTKPIAVEILQEFSSRYRQLKSDDIPGRLALAEWCKEKELLGHADNIYRQILQVDPDHTEAYRQLWRLSSATPPEASKPELDQLAKEFPSGFRMKISDRYVFLFDTGEIWADSRSRMLKQAYDNFFVQLVRDGFRPLPPRQALTCVLFNQYDDYELYAKTKDLIKQPASGGYYSPRTNRVQFFNHQSNPFFKKYATQLNQLQQSLTNDQQALSVAIQNKDNAAVRNLRVRIAITTKKITQVRRIFGSNTSRNNISTTYHEAAHQLAFNSGLQSRAVFYPFWLSEGIATNFETTNPAVPFGPAYVNTGRKASLVKSMLNGQVVALRSFITYLNPDRTDQDRLLVLYAQSWGVFHYLYKTQREQLRNYLRKMKTRRGRPSPQVLLDEFEAAFGKVDVIESGMRKYYLLPD